MAEIKRTALVAFSCEQMYQLVNDVTRYSDFLPGCSRSILLSETETEMVATLEITKLGIKQTFTTKNQLVKNRSIVMNLVNGPFQKLHGEWRFTPLDEDASTIEFNLNFEFNNRLVELAFGPIFKELANNMVSSFNKRAKEIYKV